MHSKVCTKQMVVAHLESSSRRSFPPLGDLSGGTGALDRRRKQLSSGRASVQIFVWQSLMISPRVESRLCQKLEFLPQRQLHDVRCHFLRWSAAPAVARGVRRAAERLARLSWKPLMPSVYPQKVAPPPGTVTSE